MFGSSRQLIIISYHNIGLMLPRQHPRSGRLRRVLVLCCAQIVVVRRLRRRLIRIGLHAKVGPAHFLLGFESIIQTVFRHCMFYHCSLVIRDVVGLAGSKLEVSISDVLLEHLHLLFFFGECHIVTWDFSSAVSCLFIK